MNASQGCTGERGAAGLRRRMGLGLVAGVLALGAWAGAPAAAWGGEAVDAVPGAVAPAYVDGDITLAERVAAQVLPSVGSVYCLVDYGYEQGISQGSCEVLDEQGYILTNHHVIDGATEALVILNGEAYDAEIVGADPSSDVAVLKIDPGDTELVPIAIGDSSAMRLGQWVMTVGSPFGESESVSVGIVSGLSRITTLPQGDDEVYYVGMIQTDAMINEGSSGGALVNAAGEFVGMTTLSASASGDWAGMTYAIPSNYAVGLANQIIETGVAQHPQLGASVVSLLEAYYAGSYDMGNDSSVAGAYVTSVAPGSGAQAAGVLPGDVIVAVDGVEIYSADGLIIQVRSNAIGDTVVLTVERAGAVFDLAVVLGSDAVSDAGDEPAAPAPLGSDFGWGSNLWGGLLDRGADDRAADGQGGSDWGGGWPSLWDVKLEGQLV